MERLKDLTVNLENIGKERDREKEPSPVVAEFVFLRHAPPVYSAEMGAMIKDATGKEAKDAYPDPKFINQDDFDPDPIFHPTSEDRELLQSRGIQTDQSSLNRRRCRDS